MHSVIFSSVKLSSPKSNENQMNLFWAADLYLAAACQYAGNGCLMEVQLYLT